MYNLVDEDAFERYWQALADDHPGDQYVREHKQRYYELFDHLAYFTQGKPSPRVLEVGVSALTRLYKQLFPHLELVTVDRPVAQNGAVPSFGVQECRATHHYNVDLNKEGLSPNWGDPPIGRFDFVVFCEVLEHLTVNAVQIFEELLTLVRPDGYLYLTTPNFFSIFRLQQIARRENPQEVFPRRGSDGYPDHHFREYIMTELIRFLEEAGGKVVKADFSSCWHDEPTRKSLRLHPEMRSNLLLVAAHGNSEARVEFISDHVDKKSDLWDVDASTDAAVLKDEIVRLRALVDAYERGRIIRLLKWLRNSFKIFRI